MTAAGFPVAGALLFVLSDSLIALGLFMLSWRAVVAYAMRKYF